MNSPAWVTALVRGAGARPGVLVELVLLLLWFWLFTRLGAAAGTDFAAADANAQAIQSAEHAMRIDVERSVNGWLAGNPVLSLIAVYLYRLYYVVVAGTLLWVFVRHAEVYRRVRSTMIAMMVLVLPVYWAVPMSPPRFALPGAVDIVARYDILGDAGRYAWTHPSHHTAMPSMHVGLVAVVRVRRVVRAPRHATPRGAGGVVVPRAHGGRRARHGEPLRSRCRGRCRAAGRRGRGRVAVGRLTRATQP